MTDIKPHIFIGSSSEAKYIAEMIATELSEIAECTIWTSTFEIGNSAYEDLVNKLSFYDYGILVATGDDKTVSRGTAKTSPRDNIVFEFGLFAGRLGRHRSFLFAEDGIKIPSDLAGITQPFFPKGKHEKFFGLITKDNSAAQKNGIIEKCQKIKEHIRKRENVFDFGFLPSTALAYGYFHNFVLKAVNHLMDTKKLKVKNECDGPSRCSKDVATVELAVNTFTSIDFSICIPNDLRSDMFDKIRKARSDGKWEIVKVDAGSFRPFDFSIEFEKSKSGVLYLYDIPITLNSLNEAISKYVKKSALGISEDEEILEQRELRVFKKVLDYLINSHSSTKGIVRTEIIPI